MELRVYAIYDAKAAAFNPPFFMATDALAIRAAQDTVSDPKTIFNRHPDDFVLYQVGVFNDSTGEIVGYSPALHVVAFAELVVQNPLPLLEDAEARISAVKP